MFRGATIKGLFFIWLAVALFFVYVGFAQALDLKVLQEELHKRGTPWIAGKTSVSDLPIEAKRKMLGLLPRSEISKSQIRSSKKPLLQPPASWDWRNKDGHNWMSGVRDQRGCNSHWAFACVAMLEACWNIWNSMPENDLDLSEQFIVSCNPYGYSCDGGFVDIWQWVMDETNGIPDEACYPYIASDGNCNDRCSDWVERAAPYDILEWGSLPDSDPNLPTLMKEKIMKGPIVCGIAVKEDFFYYRGGTYTPIMGDDIFIDGNFKANHTVCLVGWDDSHGGSGGWLLKNSWGSAWGDNGYGWYNYGTEGENAGPQANTWVVPLSVSGKMTVYNHVYACADLVVTNITWSASWITSAKPSSFTLAPGDSQSVLVGIAVAGLTPGEYRDNLLISSNDPDANPYVVPVTLKVKGSKESGEGEKQFSKLLTLKCYPNPVRRTVTVIYTLPGSENIALIIYDVSGREIKQILNEKAPSGTFSMKIDTKDLTPGIYFVSLKVGEQRISQKIILGR